MSTQPPASHAPLPWLLLLLSVTTGLVDAASVLGLGKVFTANMTGNVVFLGFAAAGGSIRSTPPWPILWMIDSPSFVTITWQNSALCWPTGVFSPA